MSEPESGFLLSRAGHNPDVLSCLANLSNDEVFTPPDVANAMLDMLPQELFSNPQAAFLDPVCKSGVFLREITKRLMKGLEKDFPDKQERLDHILHQQVFGIAITELTSLLARRTLYCAKYASSPLAISKFENIEGNIRFKPGKHFWRRGKCVHCGAAQAQYERAEGLESHAYEFIHTDKPEELFPAMKFDVIIGNPPYQLSDGGSGTGISAKPIYHIFIQQAIKLNPRYLIMITPSRWFAGGKGLNEFRDKFLNDCRITKIIDYPKSRECFPGVDIAGGVNYFLWDINQSEKLCEITTILNNNYSTAIRTLNEFPIFIRYNIAVNILHKIKKIDNEFMNQKVLSRNPFCLNSSERGEQNDNNGNIKLLSSGGIGYISLNRITRNLNLVKLYKVIIGKINPDRGGVNNAHDGKSNVITKINILKPNVVCTETYLLLDSFKKEEYAINCQSYFATKFTRFLVFITLSSMNITKENFQFVPLQDFSKPWTDEELYAKYNLSQEEIDFIESMIKPMEVASELDIGADDA